MQYVTGNLQEIFNYLEYTYQLSFNGNSLYTITYFLLLREDLKYHWTKEEKALWGRPAPLCNGADGNRV